MSDYEIISEVVFANQRCAEIIYDVLRVDGELKQSGVKKTVSLMYKKVTIKFSSTDLKRLRTCINSILNNLSLSLETMEAFGPPVSESYSHYN